MLRLPHLIGLAAVVLALASEADGTRKNVIKEDPVALPHLDMNLESFSYDRRAVSPAEPTLLASTLDGTLVAINQLTGEIQWELRDQPVVKSPYDANKPILPAFLPDPKDGSIYMIGGGLKDPLKKLPFTIPELVSASPCKSSDGILYTGKKVDTWFSVDRYTGTKQGSISFNGCLAGLEGQCPNMKPANILIGRTEYSIMMFDSRAEGRKWNISFFDYSTNLVTPEVYPEYEHVHFADSSSGSLVTLDRNSGVVQWEREIGSPIVAMYQLEGDGIISVPFTSVSKETLGNLLDQFNQPESNNEIIGETKLFPTLYVGEHDHGLYAMPSLVDEKTLTISPSKNGPLLLEGPNDNFDLPASESPKSLGVKVESKKSSENLDPLEIPLPNHSGKERSSVLLFGHYNVPDFSSVKLTPTSAHRQLASKTSLGIAGPKNAPEIETGSQVVAPAIPSPPSNVPDDAGRLAPMALNTPNAPYHIYQMTPRNHTDFVGRELGYNATLIDIGLVELGKMNLHYIFSFDFLLFVKEILLFTFVHLMSLENKELKAIVFLLVITVFVLIRLLQNYNQSAFVSNSVFRMSSSSIGSSSSQSGYDFTAHPVELESGVIKVGNISFDPKQILGKGCEGTFVYRGRFDNRDVAVKRVLAACFSIADREVDLLRESDEHPNVIRYFCMEQDRQFRYIALEYCVATLQDFVEGKYVNPTLDTLSVLRQATAGLMHLHSLDIVHRDIKPHNVLISTPGKKGDVRAMISDFGLCKKLKVGRMSFSRRSGVAGTEGWIAPEMMLGNRSTTCAVDMFSLGCVYYFVLSKGYHPFGESFRRQANILSGEYNLERIGNGTARNLVEKMISHEQSERPTTQATMKHPLFWSKEKTLNFLQDVSDRVDKEDADSVIVMSLERGREDLLKGGNWPDCLDVKVKEDLRKHRSYNGKFIRDLLRALRNKKHHYNELSDEIKNLYGRIPDQYVEYWTSKFPRLVIHSWQAMHCIKNEPVFQKYFDKHYDFLGYLFRPESLVPQNYGNSAPSPMQNRHNLFEPQFLTNANSLGEQESESQQSVISHWDNIDSDRLKDTFANSSKGEKLEVQEIQGRKEEENLDRPISLPAEREPFLLRETPRLVQSTEDVQSVLLKGSRLVQSMIDAPAAEAGTNDVSANNGAGRFGQKIVQLASQALEEKKMAFRPSWAEALQNITAEEKAKKDQAVGVSTKPDLSTKNENEESVVASIGAEKVEIVNNDELSIIASMSKELGEKPEVITCDSTSCDEDTFSNTKSNDKEEEIKINNIDTCGSTIGALINDDEEVENSGSGPIWILPPQDSPAKKKKKKKKN